MLSTTPRFTPALMLRPFRRRDVGALEEAVSESLRDLKPWLPWAQGSYGRHDALQYIKESLNAWNENRAFDFSIRAAADPARHLGNVSLWFTSQANKTGEIGYWVRSGASRQGVCTEATARLLEVAFEELDMHKVTLRIAIGNLGSDRVARKLGFFHEGVLRHEVRVGDEWLDHSAWSLLAEEYRIERERYTSNGWV
jgi:ribosomal-protein-serine acetyltransferase